MEKRKTIFPGSNQWAGIFGSSDSSAVVKTKHSESLTPDGPESWRSKPQPQRPHVNSLPSSDRVVPIKKGSPWKHYRNAYGLELGGYVAVLCKTPATDKLYTMRSFPAKGAERKLFILHNLNHENLQRAEEIFFHSDSYYIISEYTAISLEEFIVVRPNETQLAAIIYQVRSTFLVKKNCVNNIVRSWLSYPTSNHRI